MENKRYYHPSLIMKYENLSVMGRPMKSPLGGGMGFIPCYETEEECKKAWPNWEVVTLEKTEE